MAERLRTMIRQLTFQSDDFSGLSFSDSTKITVDLQRHHATLRASGGDYPLDTGLYVISRVFNPKALRQWIGFEAVVDHGVVEGQTVTTARFRLHDGTSQRWWNGSTWSTAALGWNTEQEVADHIATFPVTSKQIRVVVNIATTDASVSPKLLFVKLAYKARILSFYEDIFLYTLTPLLEAEVRPIIGFFKEHQDGTALDFAAVIAGTDTAGASQIEITDLDAVYLPVDNTVAEADKVPAETNILQSYNAGTKQAVLSVDPDDKTIFIEAIYKPKVIYRKQQVDEGDEPCPSITVLGLKSPESSPHPPMDHLYVANKASENSIAVPAPYRVNFECAIILKAPTAVEITRLEEAALDFFDRNPMLTSWATGEEYRMQVMDELADETDGGDDAGLFTSGLRIRVHDVLVFNRPATTEPLVTNFNRTFTTRP